MKLFTSVLATLLSLLLLACNPGRESKLIEVKEPPKTQTSKTTKNIDRIFINARVLSNDPSKPHAEAIAVQEGKVFALGSLAEIKALATENTEVIDVKGAWIFPGFVDAHGHLMNLGNFLANLDLNGSMSYDEVLERLKTHATQQTTGWITGRGWDQSLWPDKEFPDGRRLEEVAPGRSILLSRTGGHAALASPAALKEANITSQTKDPEGGRILRDQSGEPTGVLIDNAIGLVSKVIPVADQKTKRAQLESALKEANRVGLTGVHDMSVSSETLALYQELEKAGKLPLRIYVALDVHDEALDEVLQKGPQIGEKLTIRAIKIYSDGALGSRGAALLDEYSDDSGNQGLLVSKEDTLKTQINKTIEKGFQPCVHAIGDRANRVVLDIYQQFLAGKNAKTVRPRIEHAQIVSPTDLTRFAQLGVLPSMQPTHATSDMRFVEPRVGKERLIGAYAWETLRNSGATLVFGSDFPVERPHPLEGIYAAVTRMDKNAEPDDGWLPKEKLSFQDAIKAFTTGPAFAGFVEERRGKIAPGFDADFTIVTGSLQNWVDGKDNALPKNILDSEILMTIVAGETVYFRDTAH